MNARIHELARESHIDVYGLGKDRDKWEACLEKYAKLIVSECIAQCEKNVDHEYLGWGSKLSAYNIIEHFYGSTNETSNV